MPNAQHTTTSLVNPIHNPNNKSQLLTDTSPTGLPQSLAVLMAAVTNLCAGVWTAPGQRPSPEVLEAVKRLESQIRAWRPLSPEVEGQVQSANWVEKVSLQASEQWMLLCRDAEVLLTSLLRNVGD